MARSAKRVEPAPNLDEIADRAGEAMARSAFLSRAELMDLGVPRAHVDKALEILRARGFEVTKKGARVPVAAQLHAKLTDASLVPLRSIESFVEGASKREAAAASQELLDAGNARVVVRSTELFLASLTVEVLTDQSLRGLASTLATLTRTLKLAAKKRGGLLPTDVAEALRPFTRSAAERSPSPKATEPRAQLIDLSRPLRKLRGPSGLVFIPTLLRELGGAPARARVHQTLLAAAAAGRVELRPESGMGRLSAEEKRDCIPGPEGSLLSWVRDLEERQ